jgi:hypothetical protein
MNLLIIILIILFILFIFFIVFNLIKNKNQFDRYNYPDVKWPFINLKDENDKNLNLLCVRGPIVEEKDKIFFKNTLKQGVKYIGCSSYVTFPQKCINPYGDCHEGMFFDEKKFEEYVIGWVHCFREPDKFIEKKDLPKLLLSESDFSDNMDLKHNDENEIKYDFCVYCPNDDDCEFGWHYHNKNWDLCKKTIECLCNKFDLKGILIGREHCEINLNNPELLKQTDFLNYWDFVKEMDSSRFVLIPSFEDASPRTLTEALTLNKPILVNKNIVGGWKYVTNETGMFYDENDMEKVFYKFLVNLNNNTYEPRKHFFDHYGIQKSGTMFKNFLKQIYPDLNDCTIVKFPVS